MEKYQLSIAKKTVDLIYEALVFFKDTGLKKLSIDKTVNEQRKLIESLDKAGNDPGKWTELLMQVPEQQVRAQMREMDESIVDLDILIARIQIIRKRLEGKADDIMVTEFLKEVL